MKTGFQREIAAAVMSVLFLCSIPACCLGSELSAKASATEYYYPYIINTLPVDGFVSKLIVPKNSPNLLYALARSDGPLKPTDKTGLHIFDISDVTKITEITCLPVAAPGWMEISLDEKTLFLYGAEGIMVLDINNPKALREIGRVKVDILTIRLSRRLSDLTWLIRPPF
jgi:hypothetical protein